MTDLLDNNMFDFRRVQNDVHAERIAQDKKWGDQSGHDNLFWYAILGEEFGEVGRALLKNQDAGNLYNELIQVAAVAHAWCEAMRKRGIK